MNEMTYQGYTAKIEYDPFDKIFVGHIVGIRDIVSFHGSTVDELEAAFTEAVEHYLAVCAEIGQEPLRSYSGKLTLRMPPDVHMAVATAAEISSKSINQWATDVLRQAAESPAQETSAKGANL
jgi:predicted HicB family RNase H-like nuclease